MSANPLVSVIINCLNGEKFVSDAINSILKQTYQNWELIFIDNASTDGTADIVGAFLDDVRIKYFRNPHTVSLGASRNIALANCSGEYISFLDSDDLWDPKKISLQVEVMRENRHVDLIYTNALVNNMVRNEARVLNKVKLPSGNIFRSLLKHYRINLQTVMIRASVLSRMDHFFDPNLTLSEEYDFFMRILYRSQALYIDEITATYRVHKEMTSLKNIERYPAENEYVVSKLRQLENTFDSNYASELKYLRGKVGFWSCAAFMSKRQRYSAFKAILPHIFSSYRFLGVAILCFLPFKAWSRVLSFVNPARI